MAPGGRREIGGALATGGLDEQGPGPDHQQGAGDAEGHDRQVGGGEEAVQQEPSVVHGVT